MTMHPPGPRPPHGFASLRWLLAAALLSACADRSVATEVGGETGSAPAPGEPLAACVDESDCFDDWCVHPADEPGFCTFACADASSCPDGASGTATSVCLAVANDEVCALDCGANRSCPTGMRCEQIESEGGARSICF